MEIETMARVLYFFNPKIKMAKMGEFQELQPIEGLELSSVSADLYGDGRDDLSLFFLEMEQILHPYIQHLELNQLA